ALPHHQIGLTLHLDLVLILGTEQHPTADLDLADVVSYPEHLAPDQSFGHLGGRRDDDPGAAPTLPSALYDTHHHAVMQHLDLELRVRHASNATDRADR